MRPAPRFFAVIAVAAIASVRLIGEAYVERGVAAASTAAEQAQPTNRPSDPPPTPPPGRSTPEPSPPPTSSPAPATPDPTPAPTATPQPTQTAPSGGGPPPPPPPPPSEEPPPPPPSPTPEPTFTPYPEEMYESVITIDYRDRGSRFVGTLAIAETGTQEGDAQGFAGEGSSQTEPDPHAQRCVERRRVLLKKVRDGEDLVVAQDQTDENGRWTADVSSNAAGRYYAVVLQKVFQAGDDTIVTCDGDRSRSAKPSR